MRLKLWPLFLQHAGCGCLLKPSLADAWSIIHFGFYAFLLSVILIENELFKAPNLNLADNETMSNDELTPTKDDLPTDEIDKHVDSDMSLSLAHCDTMTNDEFLDCDEELLLEEQMGLLIQEVDSTPAKINMEVPSFLVNNDTDQQQLEYGRSSILPCCDYFGLKITDHQLLYGSFQILLRSFN
ncbi:hypothetical protein CEXT_167411 [Caerostris extrusa]|uniref:Uncharacterized protein n=1 Tax=Caerostris extrusa TaxID=172846 RepID=A0AAV4W6H8_CAEEX|nr:hypothetical protein CEXT_167411 [Caerostris extrusa]